LIQIINTLSKTHHSTCHKAASGIAKSSDYSILRLIFVAMLLFYQYLIRQQYLLNIYTNHTIHTY